MAARATRAAAGALAACAGVLTLALGGAPAPAAPALQGSPARGEAIYLRGLRGDGRPVQAEREGVGQLPAPGAACVGCHRPSGRGGSEGGLLVPPITGPVLFAPGRPPDVAGRIQAVWQRHQRRPAYDEASLARALSTGRDPAGEPLHAAMPRYTLDAQAQADLAAYLRQLGAQPPAGWVGHRMQLATVIAPDAPAERRALVRQAMQRWTDGLAFGAVRVQWQAWELSGPAADWPRQLDALQQAQPAFALVSGAGGERWDVVDAWCETRRLPCVMPVVDHVDGPSRHWAVHLSNGTVGEAALAAAHARRIGARRVLQLVDGPAAQAGAAALQSRLAAAGQPAVQLTTLPWPAGAARPARGDADLVVLWLPADRAQRWLAAERAAPGQHVLLSAQLAPPRAVAVPAAWRSQVQWASLRADPTFQQAGAALSLVPWLNGLGLRLPKDAPDLADVHAATYFFGDAIALGRAVPDAQFLLERLEVAVDRRPAGSAYFRLSLGPGQRIAAQGGHLLGFRQPRDRDPLPLTPYLRSAD